MTASRSRRRFLHQCAALASTAAMPSCLQASRTATKRTILDAHIHLFDPGRPGGVPWPRPDNKVLYRPALPARYAALARPEGVIGAIAVECSPLSSDNDWLLNVAARNEVIVGVIGDLDPAREDFHTEIDRLAINPLSRGIRYGNLWNRDLGKQLSNTHFIANLRRVAQHKLLLESANPSPALVSDLLRLTAIIPELRIVIDHLPQAVPPDDPFLRKQYLATLKQLSKRPNVYVKGSEILRSVNAEVPLKMSAYRPWLDTIWELFGEDRLFFGSDWPNSDQLAQLDHVFNLAYEYLATHSPLAAEKFFLSNSRAIYNWRPRNEEQRLALRVVAGPSNGTAMFRAKH